METSRIGVDNYARHTYSEDSTTRVTKKQRNRKRLFKGISFLSFAFAFILGFIIFYNTGYAHDCNRSSLIEDSNVQTNTNASTKEKYYKTVQISTGDSLWAIAEEYMDEHYESIDDYVNELKNINHLASDNIEEGNYLTVAYYL